MDAIKKFLSGLLTEPDNKTPCFVRCMAFLGGIQGLATHAYVTFIQHAAFDFQAFGVGLGVMLATLGAALGVKKDSPPEGK